MGLNPVGWKTVALLMEPNLHIPTLRCSVISFPAIFMCSLCCFLAFLSHQKLEIKVVSEMKPVSVKTKGTLGFVYS